MARTGNGRRDPPSLWATFEERLADRGVAVADIAECTPAVLQALLQDLGFAPLDCARLQTEWPRRTPSREPSAARAAVRVAIPESSAEYTDAAAAALDYVAVPGCSAVAVERVVDSTADARFLQVAELQSGGVPVERRCRLAAADDLELDPVGAPSSHPVLDSVCGGVGRAVATELDTETLEAAVGNHSACKVLVYSAALGQQATCTAEEVLELSAHGDAGAAQQGLFEGGYGSVRVQRDGAGLPPLDVVFDPSQLRAEYVVTVSLPGPSLPGTPEGSTHGFSPLRTSAGAAYCAAHPGKALEFWCPSERKLVCSHCMFVDGYKEKECVLIEAAAEAERATVAKWVGLAEEFGGDIAGVLASFDDAQQEIDAAARADLSLLGRVVADVKDRLDDVYANAVMDLTDRAQAQSAGLQKAFANVVSLQSRVDAVAATSRQALASGTALEVLRARQATGNPWPAVRVPPAVVPALDIDAGDLFGAFAVDAEVRDRPAVVALPSLVDVNFLARPPSPPAES